MGDQKKIIQKKRECLRFDRKKYDRNKKAPQMLILERTKKLVCFVRSSHGTRGSVAMVTRYQPPPPPTTHIYNVFQLPMPVQASPFVRVFDAVHPWN